MPAYIASLPVAPSNPYDTPQPFNLPVPTPNLKYNPTKNFCGYGWESSMNECFHACPSGKDDECPGGKTCHSWLTCTPSTTDPATFNVCGRNWAHASSTCSTRCFLGDDTSCLPGETCFGGVSECEGELPALTAVDVGLAEKEYTRDEIAVLLDEEIARERDDAAMENKSNWWCGTSWTNMLETCGRRCSSDDDCKPNAWTEGFCFRTTGGADNCSAPGVPAKEPVPPGSRWCGRSWNDMLETCDKQCETDEECGGGRSCWEGPGTCKYVGVPVKERSDPASLWCGTNYADAATSCVKACPGETDEECPEGTSCFSGSSCTEEGEAIVREGYRCGASWGDASENCGAECQSKDDCERSEECFSEVVCKSELEEDGGVSGMFCGTTWGDTAENCDQECEVDDDCTGRNQWCYWVECVNADASLMEEPTSSDDTKASCNAEVRQCPNGQFVGRAQVLNCDFYPCPKGGGEEEEAEAEEDVRETATQLVAVLTDGDDADLSGWGSTPLAHACASDRAGSCGLCRGDCDSDDDCRDGLMCFSRARGETTRVPGCVSGGRGDKPGMDYCYAPFPPSTTTTTTTTTTTSTTTTMAAATTTARESANFLSAEYTIENLDYARECSAAAPCRACEGDCDRQAHCSDGLLCFSRDKGSVELVPGCRGLGIPGMDYCYNPNAPTVLPPTSPAAPTLSGCSAQVLTCSGGVIVYQDPDNNCAFAPCPKPGCSAQVLACPRGVIVYQDPDNNCAFAPCPAATAKPAPAPLPTASPSTSSPTFDASTYYCGYSLPRVNSRCATAEPCPSGLDSRCSGLEVCIRGTECGSARTTTTTSTAESSTTATPSEAELCDELCVEALPSEWCPELAEDLDLPNCLEAGVGLLCESDGECATDDGLNNCGTYDIYARVVCRGDTVSQGDLMRTTGPPTSRPTPRPTRRRTTTKPTMSPITTPVPTIDAMEMEMAMATAASYTASTTTNASPASSTSISIADAINRAADANSAMLGSSQSSSERPTSPPIKAYESYAAVAFTYDRSPEGGNEATAGSSTTSLTTGDGAQEPAVGSREQFNSFYGDKSSMGDAGDEGYGWDVDGNGWDVDSYLRSRNLATRTATSLTSVVTIIIWMAVTMALPC